MSASMAAAQQGRRSAPRPHASSAEVEALGARIGRVRAAIGRVIFGQDEVVDQTLITLLSGGHVLLVGVPGLGKSRLVETLGVVLGLATKRVQFTPDLMPADIIGSEVLDEAEGRRSFRFVPGPVFCQLLMADEINRASPRTQSALLQAMQEQRVAVGGHRTRAAAAVPCAGDAESDRAGRHLSAAGGAARPLPAGGRCQLPGAGGRAHHAAGHHRHSRGTAGADHDSRGTAWPRRH